VDRSPKFRIKDTKTPVFVLGSNHHGSLSITRSLGRQGIPVYIQERNARSPVFYSRFCQGKILGDNGTFSEGQIVKHLLSVAEKIKKPTILMPYSEENVIAISKFASELSKRFLFPNNSPDVIMSVSDKKKMHFLAKKHGIATPEAFFPQSRMEVEEYAGQANYPLMLKKFRISPEYKGPSNLVVNTKKELLALYDQYENPYNPRFFVQEYIPGPVESSWMFNGYFDEKSECLFGMTGKKLLQSPPEAGVTSIGICERNKAVLEASKRFMYGVGYKGIVDIDYRFDRRDGTYKVIDVNPRIGLTFRLFVADNGLDVMQVAYLDLTGQSVPESRLVNGRKFLVEDSCLLSTLKLFTSGKMMETSAFRAQETAYFAKDDPGPFLMMCLRTASYLSLRLRKTG
jgi:D-aspartate ligase